MNAVLGDRLGFAVVVTGSPLPIATVILVACVSTSVPGRADAQWPADAVHGW